MRKLFQRNGLTIVMLSLFVVFWVGQSVTGWLEASDEQLRHGRPQPTWSEYVASGEFIEATAENWESEFFQMAAFVLLSAFLFQRGSAESKDPREDNKASRKRRAAAPHRGGLAMSFYSHSLSIALIGLFLISFALHAIGGRLAYNHDAEAHGRPTLTLAGFLASPTFWFQSLQNWQSEFLSVGALVVLSIFLRERGSAQSKPVDAPDDETGA
jgi:hypothetical protein